MKFKGRLADCLDRYGTGGLFLYVCPNSLELYKAESTIANGGIDSKRIVDTRFKNPSCSRRDQLEALVDRFEKWLDEKESCPRIFTDEDGKKYEVKEVKE